MSRADAGNFVVMSLFSAAPFPRLSVNVGAMRTLSLLHPTVSQIEGNEYCECFEGGNNQGGLLGFGEDPRPLFVCDLKGKPRRRLDGTTIATTGEPTSDPRADTTCLCINSRCLFRAFQDFCTVVVPCGGHLVSEEVQNEAAERRDTPRRFTRMEHHKGSFKVERPGYEHDPPQSFLEPPQVNVVCVRRLPSPSYEPLGPSLKDAQVSGSMEKFEPDPDHSVAPSRLVPGERDSHREAEHKRTPSTPGDNVHPLPPVEVVSDNHMPGLSLIRRQILG